MTVERNADALANKEEVPPPKKMRLYVLQVLFGAGKGDPMGSLERMSRWLRRLSREG